MRAHHGSRRSPTKEDGDRAIGHPAGHRRSGDRVIGDRRVVTPARNSTRDCKALLRRKSAARSTKVARWRIAGSYSPLRHSAVAVGPARHALDPFGIQELGLERRREDLVELAHARAVGIAHVGDERFGLLPVSTLTAMLRPPRYSDVGYRAPAAERRGSLRAGTTGTVELVSWSVGKLVT